MENCLIDNLYYRRQIKLALLANPNIKDMLPTFPNLEIIAQYIGRDLPKNLGTFDELSMSQVAIAHYLDQLADEIIKVEE